MANTADCQICSWDGVESEIVEHFRGASHAFMIEKWTSNGLREEVCFDCGIYLKNALGVIDNSHNLSTAHAAQLGVIGDALWHCFSCSVTSNSLDNFQMHLSGKRHTSKAAQQLAAHAAAASDSTGDVAWQCAMCNVQCNSDRNFQMHLDSKRHAAQAEKQADNVSDVKSFGDPVWRCEPCGVISNSRKNFEMHLHGKRHSNAAQRAANPDEESSGLLHKSAPTREDAAVSSSPAITEATAPAEEEASPATIAMPPAPLGREASRSSTPSVAERNSYSLPDGLPAKNRRARLPLLWTWLSEKSVDPAVQPAEPAVTPTGGQTNRFGCQACDVALEPTDDLQDHRATAAHQAKLKEKLIEALGEDEACHLLNSVKSLSAIREGFKALTEM